MGVQEATGGDVGDDGDRALGGDRQHTRAAAPSRLTPSMVRDSETPRGSEGSLRPKSGALCEELENKLGLK